MYRRVGEDLFNMEGEKVRIPFGKFTNLDIEDVPSSYLVWLTNQDWFNDKHVELSNKIVKELEYRDKWDRHIS
jgi:uncharacterized protein (DUF3820 family)